MPEYLGLCAGKNGLSDALCRAPDPQTASTICAEYTGAPCVHVAPTTLPVWWVTYRGRLVEVAAPDAPAAHRLVSEALRLIQSPYEITQVEARPPELADHEEP